jgi:AraC-like DNA-binding protein
MGRGLIEENRLTSPTSSAQVNAVIGPTAGMVISRSTRSTSRKRGAAAATMAAVLAERFRRYLSETPIAYLTRWRLQLGAQMLKSASSSVAQIADEVGYESEPPFNRAFKREFGLPPARFRNQVKLGRSEHVRNASTKGRRGAKR